MKRIVGSTLELSAKVFFRIGQVPIKIYGLKNTVFAIQHTENRKRFTEVLFPVTKLILSLTVVG